MTPAPLPCSHAAALPIVALAARHGLGGESLLYQLVERMRCSRCGSRPSGIAVTPRPTGLGAYSP